MASPRWVVALAGFSLFLAVVTGVPQVYWILFAFDPEAFRIGTDAGSIGLVWHGWVRDGDATFGGPETGLLAGALLDVFVLCPMYVATGVGLLRRRAWVVPVGLLLAGMVLYGTLAYVLRALVGDAAAIRSVTVAVAGNVPYLAYAALLAWSLVRYAEDVVGAPAGISRAAAAGGGTPAAAG